MRRAAVTASRADLRSVPPRDSANARTLAMSDHLGFGLEQAHELRYGSGALSDDASGRALRRQLHGLDADRGCAQLRRLLLDLLLLGSHDALEGGVPGLV